MVRYARDHPIYERARGVVRNDTDQLEVTAYRSATIHALLLCLGCDGRLPRQREPGVGRDWGIVNRGHSDVERSFSEPQSIVSKDRECGGAGCVRSRRIDQRSADAVPIDDKIR